MRYTYLSQVAVAVLRVLMLSLKCQTPGGRRGMPTPGKLVTGATAGIHRTDQSSDVVRSWTILQVPSLFFPMGGPLRVSGPAYLVPSPVPSAVLTQFPILRILDPSFPYSGISVNR